MHVRSSSFLVLLQVLVAYSATPVPHIRPRLHTPELLKLSFDSPTALKFSSCMSLCMPPIEPYSSKPSASPRPAGPRLQTAFPHLLETPKPRALYCQRRLRAWSRKEALWTPFGSAGMPSNRSIVPGVGDSQQPPGSERPERGLAPSAKHHQKIRVVAGKLMVGAAVLC